MTILTRFQLQISIAARKTKRYNNMGVGPEICLRDLAPFVYLALFATRSAKMVLPRTKPLDGVFWYILDDQNNIEWRPRPNVRGDFYLGWLGQNKNVVGAGLARLQQGQLTHICTHGTPYYWLQPYQVLPFTRDTLQAHQMPGADSTLLDFSLGGWELRDQTPPPKHPLPDASVTANALRPMLNQAMMMDI